MANRIIAAFDRMEKQIADRIAAGLTTAAKVAETSKALDMGIEEYCMFQELKSLAFANGKLAHEEAQTIYACLGETDPDTFNAQPVHIKAVLTGILKELLAAKIATRRGPMLMAR